MSSGAPDFDTIRDVAGNMSPTERHRVFATTMQLPLNINIPILTTATTALVVATVLRVLASRSIAR